MNILLQESGIISSYRNLVIALQWFSAVFALQASTVLNNSFAGNLSVRHMCIHHTNTSPLSVCTTATLPATHHGCNTPSQTVHWVAYTWCTLQADMRPTNCQFAHWVLLHTPTAQPVAGAIPLPTWCNGCTYATPHTTVPVIHSLSLPTRTPTSLVHTTLCW